MSGESVSSKSGGKIVETNAVEGQRVEKGDILVKLDTSRIDIEIGKLDRSIESDLKELRHLESVRRTLGEEESAALRKAEKELVELRRTLDREKSRTRMLHDQAREAEVSTEEARRNVERIRPFVPESRPESDLADARQKLAAAEARQESARSAARVGEEDVRLAEARIETALGEGERLRLGYARQRQEVAARSETKLGQVAVQQETRKNLELDREACTILAHTTGVVTQGHPRVGDIVEPGRPFLAIAQELGFRVDAMVAASEVGLLKVGMKARVKFDAYDYRDYGSLEGTVYFITPDSQTVDTPSGKAMVYVVRVRLDQAEVARGDRRGAVMLGMSAQVEFLTGHERITGLLFRKVREKVSL